MKKYLISLLVMILFSYVSYADSFGPIIDCSDLDVDAKFSNDLDENLVYLKVKIKDFLKCEKEATNIVKLKTENGVKEYSFKLACEEDVSGTIKLPKNLPFGEFPINMSLSFTNMYLGRSLICRN